MITMGEMLLLVFGLVIFMSLCALIWGLNELRKIRKEREAEENKVTK